MSDDETKISDLSGTSEPPTEPQPEPSEPVGTVLEPLSPTVPALIRASISADIRDYLLDYTDTIRAIERDMTREGRPSRFRQAIIGAALDAAAATAGKMIAIKICETIDESLQEKS